MKGSAAVTIAVARRVSVSVWLPADAHNQLAGAASEEGVSLPVLARRAAACAVATIGGRIGIPTPSVEATEEIRAAGYELNRLLPALGAATTPVQERAVATRLGGALERVATASDGLCLHSPSKSAKPLPRSGTGALRQQWRLVRVTTDPDTARCWEQAARAAGFRSTANWVRDALAGVYALAVSRPPTLVTIDARVVAGRVLGLLAQTGTIIATRPHLGVVLGGRLEVAEAALWTGLHSLLTYGGHPTARR